MDIGRINLRYGITFSNRSFRVGNATFARYTSRKVPPDSPYPSEGEKKILWAVGTYPPVDDPVAQRDGDPGPALSKKIRARRSSVRHAHSRTVLALAPVDPSPASRTVQQTRARGLT